MLTGEAASTGAVLARLDDAPSARPRIQEITGTLTPENNSTNFRLVNLDPGATLSVRVEATSGDLRPALSLRNSGNKVLRVDNWHQQEKVGRIEYTFKELAHNWSLVIDGSVEQGKATSGSFQLLAGANAPEILEGKGQSRGRPIFRQPIQVRVGIRLDQIIEVNQLWPLWSLL